MTDDKSLAKSGKVPETSGNFAVFDISGQTEREQWQAYLDAIAPGKFKLDKLGNIQGGGVRLTCKVSE